MTTLQVIRQSGLLESNTKIIQAIKSKAIKINGVIVDSPNEEIEIGDFLNGIWLAGFSELCQQFNTNRILVIKFGKRGKIVSIIDGVLTNLI